MYNARKENEVTIYVDAAIYHFNVWSIWQNDRTCLPRDLGNHEDLFPPGIPSPCSDRISSGRLDLYSNSPSRDSRDCNAGIGIIYL